eukprot:546308-Heterocapsa_arctica.AAC.1
MLEHPEVPEEDKALQSAHNGHQAIEECRAEVGVLDSVHVQVGAQAEGPIAQRQMRFSSAS